MGGACLKIFLLPFYLVGIGATIGAITEAVRADWSSALFLAVFGLAFIGLPTLVLKGVKAGLRSAEETARLVVEHPAQPWLWKPEWAAGRLETSGKSTLTVAWVFAIFWNGISIPVAIAILPDVIADGEWVGLFILIFPLIGSLILVWAVRATISTRKFGVSVFEMAHVPGVLGRGVGGLLRTSVDLQPPEGFIARLSCVNRVTTGSGDNRSTRESVQWQQEAILTEYQDDLDGDGVMIPIAFRIPVTAPQTDQSNSSDEMIWRLEVSADVPGMDYAADFELPVFKTEQSKTEIPTDKVAAELVDSSPFKQPPESKIQVAHHGDRVEVFFPAARNPGVGVGLTVMAVVFGGLVAVLTTTSAPFFFSVVFGAADLLLIWAAVNIWLRVTEVTAEPGAVEIRRGLLIAYKLTRFERDEIGSVETRRGMQSGKTLFTDIKIVTIGGKSVSAGSNILRKREAEWIVSLIKETAGV
jgi:hypothetical protein